MLPRQSLLEGSPNAEALGPVLDAAERALRTWEPQWTGFLEAAVREDAEQRLQSLSELSVGSDGGHAGAERRCLLLQRAEVAELRPADRHTAANGFRRLEDRLGTASTW